MVNSRRIIADQGDLKIKIQNRWAHLFCLFIVFLAVGHGCTRDSQSLKSPVIAMVNGEPITLDELNFALKVLSPTEGAQLDPVESRNLREETLNQLVEKKLLLHEARHRTIQLTQAELEAAIEQMKGEYTDEEFNELLKRNGLTPDQWHQDVSENLLMDKLIDSVISSRLQLTREEVKSYYEKHRADFGKKEEVRARQIVVSTEEAAKLIHEQLLNGADFVKLATEKSISPDRAAGGDLGYFTKGQMPEEFDIVFTLKTGTISPIVKSPYGYHIFKLEEKHPARVQSLEEVQNLIFQQLVSEKKDRLRSEWIKELKSKADIQINADLLHQTG